MNYTHKVYAHLLQKFIVPVPLNIGIFCLELLSRFNFIKLLPRKQLNFTCVCKY